MVPEAPLERDDAGFVEPTGAGWFVLNARDAPWWHREGRATICELEGAVEFEQVGIFIYTLEPGVPIGMYHWEADQEDFLVLGGAGLLIVEGEERPLRQWDFVHCPPGTNHIIVGAGDAPCVVLAVGAREHQGGEGWGGYPVDETALRHGAGVEEQTTSSAEAYAAFEKRVPGPYRDGWLPG